MSFPPPIHPGADQISPPPEGPDRLAWAGSLVGLAGLGVALFPGGSVLGSVLAVVSLSIATTAMLRGGRPWSPVVNALIGVVALGVSLALLGARDATEADDPATGASHVVTGSDAAARSWPGPYPT